MKKKATKKVLLIVLGTIGLIVILILLTIWLAFGPINSSGEIKISEEVELGYSQTYIGDFAGEFYRVNFEKNDSIIGKHTFHNMDWADHFLVDSLSDRIFVFMADSTLDKKRLNGYYLFSYESDFQEIIDTFYHENGNFMHHHKMEEILEKYYLIGKDATTK